MTPIPKPLVRMPGASKPGPRQRAVLALGSNLGDRAATLREAVTDLRAHPGITVTAVSSPVRSVAVKLDGLDPDAPAYLNAVATIDTTLSPVALLDAINDIEQSHGRERAERWGDRTLDIDIIVYGELHIDTARLIIPHPRTAERVFVLAPWAQLEPDAVLPGVGPVAGLLAACTDSVEIYDEADISDDHTAGGAET